MKAKDLM